MPGSHRPASQRSSIIVFAKRGESRVEHLKPVTFESAGIREVQDLQRWVLDKPEVLGEPLLIIDDQFSKFERSRDRLDILCLDQQGHVVVVELKRTESAGYADLQSLRYAAMVRTFTLDMAVHYLSKSRRGKERDLDEEKAKKEILDFMERDEEEAPPSQLESEPRIIIASPGFSDEVLTTVFYLREHDIDITCVSIRAYSVGEDHYILVPDVVIPLRETEDYVIQIRKKEQARRSTIEARAPPRLSYLFEAGQIKGGEVLLLKHKLPPYVSSHYNEDDPTFRATVVVERGIPRLRWEKDGNLYSPSKLASKIFKEFDPLHQGPPGGANGPDFWGTSTESLTTWAQRVGGYEKVIETADQV